VYGMYQWGDPGQGREEPSRATERIAADGDRRAARGQAGHTVQGSSQDRPGPAEGVAAGSRVGRPRESGEARDRAAGSGGKAAAAQAVQAALDRRDNGGDASAGRGQ
jgi:hypothetical protein